MDTVRKGDGTSELRRLTALGVVGGATLFALSILYFVLRYDIFSYLAIGVVVALGPVFLVHMVQARLGSRDPSRPRVGPSGYQAYSGLGVIITLFLSLPGLLLAGFLFLILLAVLQVGSPAFWIAGVFLVMWALMVGRSFVPVWLQPTKEGLIARWPRLNRSTSTPWTRGKLVHVWGPLFALGSAKALPLTWVIVRQHARFLRDLAEARAVASNPAR